jgi:hypothetical protein
MSALQRLGYLRLVALGEHIVYTFERRGVGVEVCLGGREEASLSCMDGLKIRIWRSSQARSPQPLHTLNSPTNRENSDAWNMNFTESKSNFFEY